MATLILWVHALAALLFGALLVSLWHYSTVALPRRSFSLALGATALWALAVAGIGTDDATTALAEAMRNLAWLGFMFALERRGWRAAEGGAVGAIYVIVALLMAGNGAMALVALGVSPADMASIDQVGFALRMMAAVSALVLVHHVYLGVAPRARGGIRLTVVALAALWLGDLLAVAGAYLGAHGGAELLAARGVAVALLAPTFAVAMHRGGDWTLKLSRTIAYQALLLAAVGIYVVVMVLVTGTIATLGGLHARALQTAFVLGSTTAIATIASSPWLRAWVKVKLAKHLFSHRYDYRAEWIGFTDTLGKPGEGAEPLATRIVKAVADLTDSPAGLLLTPDGAGIGYGAAWNWDDVAGAGGVGDAALVRYLETTGRIVELDAVRDARANAGEQAVIPLWMRERADAWVLVPLVHFGNLAGAILLARPPIDRRPDWEDLDLLRIAGRQVASYLAEAHAQQALSDAARFDEFNRRFAFILHDIKNLVSQISLVARNAERHAENPEFRADMIATLNDSAGRMNDLLARLSQIHTARADTIGPVEILPLMARVAARFAGQHPVHMSGAEGLCAQADMARVEQLLVHLVQNAIEASPAGEAVLVAVSAARCGVADGVAIDIVDQGCGMTPAFVRDQLFKPFVSSKKGGFGLGAFEARQLAEAMGGTVDVSSRVGEGTRFRVTLMAARGADAASGGAMEQAA